MIYNRGIKSGFTLIELLVVVTILGLLAIVVLPAFTAGGDKRLLRGAADRLDTHLKHAAARATGKPRGAAVLLQPDVGTAVLDLVFARIPAGRVNDLAVLTPHSNPRKIMVDVFTNQAGEDGVTANQGFDAGLEKGGLIRFDNSTDEFEIENIVEQPPLSRALIEFTAGQTPFNTTWPQSNSPIGVVVFAPPTGSEITKRPTVLPDRACVDLAASTVGVYGFGDYSTVGTTPTTLNSYDRVVICFDVYGKAVEVLGWSGAAVARIALSPGTPIALLCTLAYQSGASQAAYPTTEESPGAGWQNPDAFWVVIDPKTGRNIIVQNYFEPTSLQEAQTFIRNDLLAQ